MNKKFFEWIKLNIGSCLSWAITFGWLIFIYFKIHNGVLPKDLNEFGDFIAGAFAPLAFFWLVRGFYQQGKGLAQNSEVLKMQAVELRASSEALRIQALELKNNVYEQKKIFELHQQEVRAKHFAAKPFLIFKAKDFLMQDRQQEIYGDKDEVIDIDVSTQATFLLVIKNEGDLAKEVSIIDAVESKIIVTKHEINKKDDPSFEIHLLENEIIQIRDSLTVRKILCINYHDQYGLLYSEEIELSICRDSYYPNTFDISINRYT